MASLAADDLEALLKRCHMDPKQIKQVLKNDKVGVKFARVARDAGVFETGCEKKLCGLLYMIASKIKKTHEEGFLAQLSRAAGERRLDTNQRVTEALKLVHKSPPDSSLTDAEIDEACGVGLEVTPEELQQLVAGVFEKVRAELEEKRYTYSTGLLQVAAVNCDPRMKWANGLEIRNEVLRLQAEILGPKTAADEEMIKANKKGKNKGKDKKKKEKKKKSDKGGGKKGDAGESKAKEDNMFTNRARFPKTAFNSKEAIAAHKALTGGKIRTRFPPEPNGYLHIGHAKSMVLNFEWAFQELGVEPGDTFLRFDDTNPKAESKEFIDNIIENVSWLGWKPCDITHSSDHFQALYDFGERLIKQGDAFVCNQTAEEMKVCKDIRRGLTTPEEIAERSKDYMSPCRDRPAEESLKMFRDMRDGKYNEGEVTLRLKMDWASPFPVMWDTVAYRIIRHPHPHTGDKWVIYPTYDYTHCIIDSLEEIDYSLCTLEFEARRDSYYWLVDKLAPPLYKSLQFEFSRLNIEYAQLSKRRLKLLVEANHVDGWDDPRLFTINGLRRRGFTAEGINNFIRDVGFSRNENVIEIDRFHFHTRAHLNEVARRATAVTGVPVQIEITNFPESATPEIKFLPNHPKDKSYGKRPIPFSRTIWLSREDWRDVNDDKDFYGLAPGKEIRLKYAYNIKCTEILERDAASGLVTKVAATYDPENKNKCKVLTWLGNDENNNKPRSAEVRIYHHLFTCPVPGAAAKEAKKAKALADKLASSEGSGAAANVVEEEEDEDAEDDGPPAWLDDINPNSKEVTTHLFDASVFAYADKPFTHFQMERVGYYTVDPESTLENPIFNRTLTLRERADKRKVGQSKA